MQLPKYKKRIRYKHKICGEPGCGREFLGHPIAKYCEIHQIVANRKRKRKKFEDVNVKNQIFKHKFTDVTIVNFKCQLKGCGKYFTVKVFPKQYVAPKYCELHRSEYKRFNFLRTGKN